MNMQNTSKIKKFWLFIILFSIIYVVARSVLFSGLECSGLGECFGDLKLLLSNNEAGNSEIILNRKVVQEESAIIDVVDYVSPSVVSIVIKTVGFDPFSGPYSYEDGIGTGFIVNDSYIITNSHVVDSSGDYSVVLKDGTAYDVVDVHMDRPTDLAILEIDAEGLQGLELGDSDTLKVGQTAIAIGNALGRFDNTVTVGVVSGIARELQASSGFGGDVTTYENVIQTDAALNPGNSGGPLLNSSGQVIGINVATTRGADNISFAIPVNTLKPLLNSFIKEGRIIRPYMGIGYSIISSDIARVRRLPEGAFVSRVLSDSPADKAGIKRGDIIVSVDGVEVNETSPITKIIQNLEVGETIDIVVDREGETLDLSLTLEESPQN